MHAQSTTSGVGARSHVPSGAEGNRTLSLSIANAGVVWGFLETRRHGEASSVVSSWSREPSNHGVARAIESAGLRRDEALTLMVIDVDLDASLLTVSDRERRKTERSAAAVPIPPELVEILRAWIPRCASRWVFPGIRRKGPWTGGACGERACDQIRQAGQDVGVAGLTLMSLRHTWATHARRTWGLSEIEVATVLRHSSPATQAWYVHDDPDPGAIIRSVEKVSYQRKDKQ